MAETLALSDALGLDPGEFVDVFAESPLASPYAVAKGRAMIAGDFAPGFPLRHAFKDTALAVAAARELGLELPLTGARGALARRDRPWARRGGPGGRSSPRRAAGMARQADPLTTALA